ncbi:ABC-2 type transport system ATP-binding protein [Virgibacillus natechei]|uniref:ABC-2 type transport system ATP-binding protein n=1 Tax=Virgibacillus natechei TaxID=1216297 RepID=A0ABS4IMV8_9BACI|nr:ATP-binding cassette domain-containing protein [Virgibacillus natechei]MBP1971756.1 ABC-2 type transport system ATP-binding protein [Virgibacillus natechei]UZD12900.1 ATP-binding cassette domain-containing protein [Virgibacillus natechei]
MAFIEVSEITKKFGEKIALDHFSMKLKENEVLGVIGHNGAGKTTLFKLLLEMYAPDQGEIKFNEKNFHIKNDIGYLPEQRGLYGKTAVYAQLFAFGYLKGKSKAELQPNIDFWMKFFKVEENRNDILANLSKGNQQKVQFITAVIHNPKFLILDEPFSGLDPINVDMFMNAIQIMQRNGSTIIYSSHKLDSIEHLSTRLLFLKDGRKVYLDDIGNIQKQYGYRLKIKNDSLTEKILLEHGFRFEVKNGIFEVILQDKKDAEYVASLLTNTYSEMFLVEQRSIEEIFKLINNGG